MSSFDALDVSLEAPLAGLTEAEAARRLVEAGPNELPQDGGRSVLAIIGGTLREPMFLLIAVAAALYVALGDLGEGLFLVAAAAASIGLVVAQEARSERALSALRELAEPHVRVIREGAERRLPARDVAPGDLMLIGEGERLVADGLLVGGDVLSVDESALTGESAPVTKRLAAPRQTFDPSVAPHSEPTAYLFSGTLVVRGQGVVRVGQTGARTALGRIGGSLAAIQTEPTPLQKSFAGLIRLLGAAALGFCAVIAVAYGLLRRDWTGGALNGVTAAISLVPEEIPMVLAVFMALGAWRLAAQRVLVRRGAAIEALGSASVLCVDKTGTLTENRMRLTRVWSETFEAALTPGEAPGRAAGALVEMAALASAVRPVDPMDRAVREFDQLVRPGLTLARREPERIWPLQSGRLAVVQLWPLADGGRLAAAKGAPEDVLSLCRVESARRTRILQAVARLADEGLRVLAVGSRRVAGAFPDEPDAIVFEFAGLIGFLDPLRADASQALAAAAAAGVRVVMITGDHPATAQAIARAAGLDGPRGVLTGPEIAALPFPSLCERVRHTRVFARVAPEQKLLIVEAFKADGAVVAMTGDGVNDAPALESAHIGIAMGLKGTDVAREAADLVLLDDSFASIIGGVRLGRRIFENLRKALVYITAIHIPIAGLALAPILLGLPPVLYPMHVVLLELAIDPICALVFESEPGDPGAMLRPPRAPDEPLFGVRQLAFAAAQGAGIFAAVLAIYLWALGLCPEPQARGAAFLTLVLGNLTLALADSMAADGRLLAAHRLAYWTIAAAAVGALAAGLEIPLVEGIFHMGQPPAPVLLTALAAAVVSGSWARLLRPRSARSSRRAARAGATPAAS